MNEYNNETAKLIRRDKYLNGAFKLAIMAIISGIIVTTSSSAVGILRKNNPEFASATQPIFDMVNNIFPQPDSRFTVK